MKARVLLLWACAGIGLGQTSPAPDGFDKASLGWRTALHFDPGAEAPLASLVQLYRAQGRQEELIKIYEDHVAQYPADEGALVVLARIYLATSNDRLAAFVEKAAADHPNNAILHHIRFDWLRQTFKPGALEELDRAVALEGNGPRRSHWLEELLKLAAEQRSEAVIEARFRELVKAGSLSPGQRPAWARRAMEAGLLHAAEAAMAGLQPGDLTGDEGIEARFVRTRLSLARGKAEDAAGSAAELLERLAIDHWRYREALSLRWEAARSESDREGLLEEARRRAEQAPTSEAAALNYGELLLSAGREDEALRVWSEASERLSGARLLEERLLDSLERVGRDDELLAYLTKRGTAERPDLRLRRARVLLVMGKAKEGMVALEDLMANTAPGERAETWVQTARWLRTRLLLTEAAAVLEHLIREQPDRWDARKELGELFLTLKRSAELEKLFNAEPPANLPREVRLEVALFLYNHRMWGPCRRLLEDWVTANPVEFDGRLLLFKTYFLLGDRARADRMLDECRTLCDTDTRYAAWFSAAWWSAQDEGAKQQFLEHERRRLWPATGSKWDPANLSRLAILIGQTQDSEARDSVEVLLEQELQDPVLPLAQKTEARRNLIRLLTGSPGRERDLETEIRAALDTPGESKGDLMLELVKLYSASQRSDLAVNALVSVDPAECRDASLLVACANVATTFNQNQRAIQFLERAVELQPDERTYWSTLINALLATGDEETIRLTLRALLARSASWDLPEWQRDVLRKHLESSYWRSVGRRLMAAPNDSSALKEALILLDERDAAAAPTKQLRWSDWARGVIHVRLGNAKSLEAVRQALGRGDGEWIKLPDGLSLSRRAALAHLTPGDPLLTGLQRSAGKVDKAVAPRPPLDLQWVLEADSGTHWMRWDLTKDGTKVLAVDSRNLLWSIDSASGKLLWKRHLPQSQENSMPVPLPYQPSRGEQVSTPPEWCLMDSKVFVLNDGFLAAMDTATGVVKWTQEVRPTPNQGLACADGTVFWWRPQDGKLDAVDAASGKLLWATQPLSPWPPSAAAGTAPSSSLQWYASGVAAESGKVLVWCNGSALAAAADGSVLWHGSADNELAGSPLTFSSGQVGTTPTASVPVLPWETQAASFGMPTHRFANTPFSFGSMLAAPMYAYPGMFGNSGTAGTVTWGATSFRLLKGGAVWSASPVGLALNTTVGVPVSTKGLGFNRNGAQGTPVGFAGNALILADGMSITREDPLWGSLTLWNGQINGSRRNQQGGPLPCAALAGTTLLLAVDDSLRIQDAISGSIIWQGGWPEEAKPWLNEDRNGLANWQNVRWSSHGLLMNDGRGSTMAVDWKGLAAGRDWIVPCGTRALVCLRGAGSALESGHEDRASD